MGETGSPLESSRSSSGASFCDKVLNREDVADRRMQAVMDAGWVVWEKHTE